MYTYSSVLAYFILTYIFVVPHHPILGTDIVLNMLKVNLRKAGVNIDRGFSRTSSTSDISRPCQKLLCGLNLPEKAEHVFGDQLALLAPAVRERLNRAYAANKLDSDLSTALRSSSNTAHIA